MIADLTPEQIVQAQLEAYNAQDVEKFCEYFSEDVFAAGYLGDVICQGIEAWKQRHVKIFAEFPNNTANLVHRIVLGETVIDHEDVSRGNGDANFLVGCIYTIKNARITRVEYVKAS